MATCEFKDLKEIGKGSYGIVYRARTKKNTVAIKKLEEVNDVDITDIIFLGSVDHPYINKITDVLTHDECMSRNEMAVVMPLAAMDLFSYQANILDKDVKMELMYQLVDAVQALHAAGIWHLDIKPENVLIRKDEKIPHALLADFGLSMLAMPGVPTVSTYQKRITRRFRPPEIQGERGPYKVTNTADVYSLGVLFLEMWLDEYDIKGTKLIEKAKKVKPSNLSRLLVSMLQPDPAERSTISQVVQSSVFENRTWHPLKARVIRTSNKLSIPFEDGWNAFIKQVNAYNEMLLHTFFRAVDLFWLVVPFLVKEKDGYWLRNHQYKHRVTMTNVMDTILHIASIIAIDEPYDLPYDKHVLTFILKLTNGHIWRPSVIDKCQTVGQAVTALQNLFKRPKSYPKISTTSPVSSLPSVANWIHRTKLADVLVHVE